MMFVHSFSLYLAEKYVFLTAGAVDVSETTGRSTLELLVGSLEVINSGLLSIEIHKLHSFLESSLNGLTVATTKLEGNVGVGNVVLDLVDI
jgi:hypothetical protein